VNPAVELPGKPTEAFPMLPEITAHPGQVTVIAPDGSEMVQLADSLPDWMKFARGRDGRTAPVVLIVRVRTGRGFTLRSYGPDGRLLTVSTSPDGSPVPPAEVASGWF
jgi:hypothetical protein